jgi:hypothetical protein
VDARIASIQADFSSATEARGEPERDILGNFGHIQSPPDIYADEPGDHRWETRQSFRHLI